MFLLPTRLTVELHRRNLPDLESAPSRNESRSWLEQKGILKHHTAAERNLNRSRLAKDPQWNGRVLPQGSGKTSAAGWKSTRSALEKNLH